jgi:hypothetical protein
MGEGGSCYYDSHETIAKVAAVMTRPSSTPPTSTTLTTTTMQENLDRSAAHTRLIERGVLAPLAAEDALPLTPLISRHAWELLKQKCPGLSSHLDQ